LLMLGEDIAFLGRGEAALRRQTEPVEIGKARQTANLSSHHRQSPICLGTAARKTAPHHLRFFSKRNEKRSDQ
jgi:hypothetical protein